MTDKNKVLIDISYLKDANDVLYNSVLLMRRIIEHFSSHESMSKEEMANIIKSLGGQR